VPQESDASFISCDPEDGGSWFLRNDGNRMPLSSAVTLKMAAAGFSETMVTMLRVESFVRNGSVKTFPRQKDAHATIEVLLETVFST
jgi:hypothetical protein